MSGTIGRGLFGLLLTGVSMLGYYMEGPNGYSTLYAIVSGVMFATVYIDIRDRARR